MEEKHQIAIENDDIMLHIYLYLSFLKKLKSIIYFIDNHDIYGMRYLIFTILCSLETYLFNNKNSIILKHEKFVGSFIFLFRLGFL